MTMTKEKTTPAKAFEILCNQLQKRPAAQKLLMAHLSAVTGTRAPLGLYHNTFCPQCRKPEYCEKCADEKVAMYRIMVKAMLNNDYSILEGQDKAKAARDNDRKDALEAQETVATQTTTAEPPPETETNTVELVSPVRRGVKPKPAEREPITIESEGDDELTKLLIRRLAPHMPKTGAVDEERVKQLIADEIVSSQAASETEFKALALDVVRHALSNGEFPVDRVKEIIKEALAMHATRLELTVNGEHKKIDGFVHKAMPTLLKMAAVRENVLLVGPAGSGKTTAAEQVAKALDLPFSFNGAIDTEYKLLGFIDAQGRLVSRPFRKAYEHGGVYLFDELDGSLPPAALAFNAALANNRCDFPDGSVERHKDFICLAAGNTWGNGATFDYVGRMKQDAAFMDRFAALSWDYDETLEMSIATNKEWCKFVQQCRANVKRHGLKVIISPRATFQGERLLAGGVDRDTVIQSRVRKGMTDDQWSKIKPA